MVEVYTEDPRWRNRAEFPVGREQVHAFLVRKWAKELDYRPIKALGCMEQRHTSINDRPIHVSERLFHWPLGRCPDDHPVLTELGL